MNLRDGIKKALRMWGHAFTSAMHDRLEAMEQRHAETDNVLLRAALRLAEQVRRTSQYEVADLDGIRDCQPAMALVRYLYSVLPSRAAAVIGPCDREWTCELAAAGYAVNLAAPQGSSEDAAIVRLCGTVQLGALRPAVVVADLEGATDECVKRMRSLGYWWHLVVDEPGAGEAGRFYANYAVVLPAWTGNTIFFRDHATFLHALKWCQAVLRQVYFGPKRTTQG